MILEEVTLTLCLLYLQMQFQNTLYRGSYSYNLFDIFTNALLENNLREVTLTICLIYLQIKFQNTLYRGSNSFNLFDIFTNAISEHTISGK